MLQSWVRTLFSFLFQTIPTYTPQQSFPIKVTLHFLGEQHGKGPVDQLFGWTCAWIESFLQNKPIYGIQDLLQCYKKGAQDMVDTDPQGPKFHIMKFDPGEDRPLTRSFFQCPDFLITRTYCLHAELVQNAPNGLRIRNNVFSDSHGDLLRHWHVEVRDRDEEDQPMPQAWRRGFWQGERPWEQKGPKPGDINEFVRRHLAQKHTRPPQQHDADNEVDVLLLRAAARLQKAATKKRR